MQSGGMVQLGSKHLYGIQEVMGSNPTISTKIIAGRIPDGEIYLFVYGFVLAVKIASGR